MSYTLGAVRLKLKVLADILLWLVDNVPLGRLAPWVLGIALGRFPRKAKK